MSEVKFRELRNAPPMVINFAKAVLRATVKPGSNPTLPEIGLRLNDVALDEKHLAAYRKVCGFAADGSDLIGSLLQSLGVSSHECQWVTVLCKAECDGLPDSGTGPCDDDCTLIGHGMD